jgi:hypothetical protein
VSDQAREIERVAKKLAARLFGAKAELELKVVRAKDGSESIVCNWTSRGWQGYLSLCRTPCQELSARELGGVLKVLRDVGEED